MLAIFAQRPIGSLASLDVTWMHVHRTSKTGGMNDTLEQPNGESLKKRRKDSRLIMLYKGIKVAASNNLVLQTGVPGIIIHWQFKHHWMGLIFSSPISSSDYKRLELSDRFPYLCF